MDCQAEPQSYEAGPGDETLIRRRRAWLSGLLSAVTPGLGHLYCGYVAAAICVFLAVQVLVSLAFGLMLSGWLGWVGLLASGGLLLGGWLSAISLAALAARRRKPEYVLKPYNRWYVYLIVIILAAGGSQWLLSFWGDLKTFKIPSPAMENTLKVGDLLLVDMAAYEDDEPSRGDVVIFIYPLDGETLYVKRCVAIPGDIVQLADKVLHVNGVATDEPGTVLHTDTTNSGALNIHPRGVGGANSRDNFGPYSIPAGSYFMLGDSRDNSSDSRYWGPVPRDLVLGKAFRVYWSRDLDRIGLSVE